MKSRYEAVVTTNTLLDITPQRTSNGSQPGINNQVRFILKNE
jgi:hypothetical protein